MTIGLYLLLAHSGNGGPDVQGALYSDPFKTPTERSCTTKTHLRRQRSSLNAPHKRTAQCLLEGAQYRNMDGLVPDPGRNS